MAPSVWRGPFFIGSRGVSRSGLALRSSRTEVRDPSLERARNSAKAVDELAFAPGTSPGRSCGERSLRPVRRRASRSPPADVRCRAPSRSTRSLRRRSPSSPRPFLKGDLAVAERHEGDLLQPRPVARSLARPRPPRALRAVACRGERFGTMWRCGAVALCNAGRPGRSPGLARLGLCTQSHVEGSGSAARGAVALCDAGRPGRSLGLARLGLCAQSHVEESGSARCAAVPLWRSATQVGRGRGPKRAKAAPPKRKWAREAGLPGPVAPRSGGSGSSASGGGGGREDRQRGRRGPSRR